jgi:hypothetical protein
MQEVVARLTDGSEGRSFRMEMVCFRLTEWLALDKAHKLRGDRDAVQVLPPSSFIGWHQRSLCRFTGRVF